RPRGKGGRRKPCAGYGATQAAHGREGSCLHRPLRLHVSRRLASIARGVASSAAEEPTTMPNPPSDAEARAFWITAPGRGEIRAEALAPPADGEVLVETLYSGISRGTESLVFAGRVPPSEYERMRAPFQAGDFPAPVKYGYASVGRVLDGPAELRERVVFCLHPHQTRYVVPASAAHPLPDDVPPGRAVLAANLETAVNGLWDAAPALGDRIAVVGAGTVGCLAAWLAAGIPGTRVELVDVDPGKRAAAEALGVRFA